MTKIEDGSSLNDYVVYDENSPSGLSWKIDRFTGKDYTSKIKSKGQLAGSVQVNHNGKSYWRLNLLGVKRNVHRVIWEILHGSLKAGEHIDHIDGDGLNNKIENLRVVDQRTNNQNKKIGKSNKSGVTGVCKMMLAGGTKPTWTAIWKENGRDRRKEFSILKYGEDLAFQLACACRKAQIERLNREGQNYSNTHGE